MNRNSKTFKIALGGICLALSVICIFGASFVPGIELTLFAISSLFTAVMILETGKAGSAHGGVPGALLVFAGTCLLGLVLLPNKLAIIPYLIIFGYYPILKFYVEKLRNGAAQLGIKLAFFAGIMAVGFLALKTVLAQAVRFPDYPVFILIIGGSLFMLVYDFVLSFLINWYIRRFKTGDAGKFKLN